METALVLLVPEADLAVAPWREQHDPAAARGMPAHITVLYPFMPYTEIDVRVHNNLAGIFGNHAAFALQLEHWARFPGVLYLRPEPSEPIAAMTRDVMACFPDWPLYGGAFPEITPHLTVAQTDEAVAAELAEHVPRTVTTPISSRIDACALFDNSSGRWQQRHRFLLRQT